MIPMPSPRGTNRERLFLPPRSLPILAMDEMPRRQLGHDISGETDPLEPGEDQFAELLSFLESRLSPGDLEEVRRHLGSLGGGGSLASDSAVAGELRRYGVDPSGIARGSWRAVLSQYRRNGRKPVTTDAERASFADRYPDAARIAVR